jgi:hypothetical protein
VAKSDVSERVRHEAAVVTDQLRGLGAAGQSAEITL